MTDDQKQDAIRAWEYYKNADSLLVARFNYGMIAQSMLLVAFEHCFPLNSEAMALC